MEWNLLAARFDYDEFRVIRQAANDTSDYCKFAGAIHDPTPGLYLMGARYSLS